MKDVKYKNDKNLTITSDMEIFDISFNKDKFYFMDNENYVNFIKACEKLIRKSPDYTQFVDDIREFNMEHCQVLGNISRFDAELQVHHGPMLTLFDYCAILINYWLSKEEPINTFRVAEAIVDEHMAGNVQLVVLCKTVHQLIDTGEIFINLNQGIGNVGEFLKKYKEGITDVMREKINKYIDLSQKFDSHDNNILELEKSMVDWSYRKIHNDMAKRANPGK